MLTKILSVAHVGLKTIPVEVEVNERPFRRKKQPILPY